MLSPKQEEYARLLALGVSKEEASKQVGVTARQARTWVRRNPEIEAMVRELGKASEARSITLLSSLLAKAAATMGSLLAPAVPPGVRLRAATAIFTVHLALRQVGDLADELEALKTAVQAGKEGPP